MQLDNDDMAFLWETVDNTCLTTRKDQRFYYQTSQGGGEGGRRGAGVEDTQELALSTFPSPLPLLDELVDLSSLINSGILSPNLAQQLSFAQPAMVDNGSNTNASAMSQGYPPDPVMPSQLLQDHTFLDASFRSWSLGADESIGSLLPQYYHPSAGAS